MANLSAAWLFIAAHGTVTFDWNPHFNPRPGDPIAFFVRRRPGAEWVVGCGRPGTLVDRHPESVKKYPASPWWPREAVTGDDEPFAVAAGWPLLSFSAWRTATGIDFPDKSGWFSARVHHWGIVLADTDKSAWEALPALLPFRPIWPGVAVNAVLYAIVFWATSRTWRALRSELRARRGLCLDCAYPIGAADRCSECGFPHPPGALTLAPVAPEILANPGAHSPTATEPPPCTTP